MLIRCPDGSQICIRVQEVRRKQVRLNLIAPKEYRIERERQPAHIVMPPGGVRVMGVDVVEEEAPGQDEPVPY